MIESKQAKTKPKLAFFKKSILIWLIIDSHGEAGKVQELCTFN